MPNSTQKQVEDFDSALRVVVNHSIRETVREDPQLFIEALTPGLLPAIKKMISTFFNELVESVQHILESGLSLKNMGWRIEALRSGKSYTEIALLHLLVYRVEEVFLIDHESGLLLARQRSPNAYPLEADAVSGMVTALLAFMRDAFRVNTTTASGTLRYDEFTVWIERGERMTIASFFRGSAPFELRETLRKSLVQCQTQFAGLMGSSQGRTEIELKAAELMKPCLMSAFKRPEAKSPAWYYLSWLAVVLLPLLIILYQIHSRISFERYKTVIENIPGVVITKARRGWSRYSFSGLRDAYSPDPANALIQAGLNSKQVNFVFQPFISPDGRVLQARLHSWLNAPETLKVSIEDGEAHFTGSAPFGWLKASQRKMALLNAWNSHDIYFVADDEFLALKKLKNQVELTHILFATNLAVPTFESLPDVTQVAEDLFEMNRLANLSDRKWHVLVQGFTDTTGAEQHNWKLSVQRANQVAKMIERLLQNRGVTLALRSVGLGPSTKMGRAVTFQVALMNATGE